MSGTSPLRQEIVIMPPEIRDVGSEVQLHFAVDGLSERSLWFTVDGNSLDSSGSSRRRLGSFASSTMY